MTQPHTIMTLCLLRRAGRLALAQKLRGFGVNRWNGYGGHVEKGEAIEEAALRELFEESGNQVEAGPLDLHKAAILNFHFPDNKPVHEVHVFLIDRWQGEPQATEEMGEPRWFDAAGLLAVEEQMWAADRLWLPPVLGGRSIYGTFIYNADGSEVIEHRIIEASFIP